MAITENKSSGSEGVVTFSQIVPEVTLSLAPGQTPGVQRGMTVDLRATWSTVIDEQPQGITAWDTTYGDAGTLLPQTIASVGSQSIFDVTINLPTNGSGKFTYIVPQQSASAETTGTSAMSGLGPSENVSIEITYDTRFPDVVLSTVRTGTVFRPQVTVTATFSEFIGTSFIQGEMLLTTNDVIDPTLMATIATFTERTMGMVYDAVINVPESRGSFQVAIQPDVVESVVSSKTGPMVSRTLDITYDRLTVVIPSPPAPTLEIIVPDELPYRYTDAIIKFRYSSGVTDFGTEATDIDIPGTTFDLNDIVANIQNTEFDLPITLPTNMMGTITITVPADAATLIEDSSVMGPAMDVTASFAYDTRAASSNDIPGTTTICEESYLFDMNPYLDDVLVGDARGGAFIDGKGLLQYGSSLYCVFQIQKKREVGARLNPEIEAGAALVRVDLINTTCTILKTYEFVTEAAHSFEVHNGEVYFFEGSAYSSRQSASMGHLYRIDSSQAIHDLGLVWRSAEPSDDDLYRGAHSKTISPIVSDGENVTVIAGYGLLDKMIDDQTDASNLIENWQWVQLGRDINPRIDVLETNNKTGYSLLRELSIITNSVIGIRNDEFFYTPRTPLKATLHTTGIPQSTPINEIDYTTAEVPFPSSGYLFIGTELFQYTGNSVGTTFSQFTGVTRGIFGTSSASDIMGGSDIWLVNHFLDIDEGTVEDPINDFRITLTPHLYNDVTLFYGNGKEYQITNDTSISSYGKKTLNLTVPLSSHQREWVANIAQRLLDRYALPRYRVEMVLKSSFHYVLGDVVLVREEESGFFDAVQVLGRSYNGAQLTTTLTCETF